MHAADLKHPPTQHEDSRQGHVEGRDHRHQPSAGPVGEAARDTQTSNQFVALGIGRNKEGFSSLLENEGVAFLHRSLLAGPENAEAGVARVRTIELLFETQVLRLEGGDVLRAEAHSRYSECRAYAIAITHRLNNR